MNIGTVGIFGGSGMARETGDIARAMGHEPLYLLRDEEELSAWDSDEPADTEANLGAYPDLQCVVGIADNRIRRRIVERFGGAVRWTNLIHPSATLGRGQRELIMQRRGTIIAPGVRWTVGISLGDFCIINQNATVAHDVDLGDFIHLAPQACISGNVAIESGCWIGASAVINQGTPEHKRRVGENTTVGSGAVVVRDCDSNAVYAGVPARRLR